MKIRTLLSAFLVLILTVGKAQTVPVLLKTMLDNTLDSMQLYVNNKSMSAAVQLNNTAIWSRAAGISSLTPYADATVNDAYNIGSVTKTFTAACILNLHDQGLLSIDDSLHEWLDTINYVNPDLTLRQLLRHQSGLYEILANPAVDPALWADQDSVWSGEDFVTTFIQPAPGVPGGPFSYCNTNYFLLGMVIEAVTGNPFQAEIRSRFLNPQGLTTIGIPSMETYSTPVCHLWWDITGDGVTDDAHSLYYNWESLNSTAGAAGAYYGTASDLTQWMRTYMRGDILLPATMADAQTTITAGGMPATYGLGMMKKTFIGLTGYGHGGDFCYSASSWYFPSRDISITVLNNDADWSSWQLIPTVTALLKTYLVWEANTSVSENELNLNIATYPNPFTSELNLALNLKDNVSSLQLVLRNALGQEVSKMEVQDLNSGEQTLSMNNVSELESGMYFLSAYVDGKFAKTLKVVK